MSKKTKAGSSSKPTSSSAFIPNGMLGRLAQAGLSGTEYSVILAILRLTLGWKDKHSGDYIPISKLRKLTGRSDKGIRDALRSLQAKKILDNLEEPTFRKPAKWRVKDHQDWMLRGENSTTPENTPEWKESTIPQRYSTTTLEGRLLPPYHSSNPNKINKNGGPIDNLIDNNIDRGGETPLQIVESVYQEETGQRLVFPNKFKKADFSEFLEKLDVTPDTLRQVLKDAIPAARRKQVHFATYFTGAYQFHLDRVNGEQGGELGGIEKEYLKHDFQLYPGLKELHETLVSNYGTKVAYEMIEKEVKSRRKPRIHFLQAANGDVLGWQREHHGKVTHEGRFGKQLTDVEGLFEANIPDEILGEVVEAWENRGRFQPG